MTTYRAALIGCGRIGAFIDNEVTDPYPYSHAAAYEACERTTLVACADQRTDVMARAGERYGVPTAHQYTDYREMLAAERPDIVSVATQPEHRADIVIHAAEHGARAIYAEKAMAASLAEADAMVQAVERNGVAFNMGTNRRWHAGYRLMRSLIAEGRYGALRSLTVHCGHGLFNMGSHAIDLLLLLNGDAPVSWVQFHLSEGADRIEGATLRADPSGGGLVRLIDDHTEYFRSHLQGFAKTERRVYLATIDLWQPSTTGEITARARLDVRTVSTMLGRLVHRGALISEGDGRKRQYSAAEQSARRSPQPQGTE